MKEQNNNVWKLIPIMLCFFVMGFVDLVGIATNYVQADYKLSDTVANLFPSMVFFWFLVCSVPTGMLMNKIGRRKTVLISIVATIIALAIPLIHYSFVGMLLSFSFLGIGNALMQVSLNPLISNIVNDKRLPSTLTLGQFVKAIASFIAPLLAGWLALHAGDWKLLYPIYMAVAIIACIALWLTPIRESDAQGKTSSFADCFSLLGDKLILLSFVGILCHVGIDVGINVTAPKLLIERLGIDLTAAGDATSVYFLFRTFGCLAGAFLLVKFAPKRFFLFSVVLMLVGIAGLFFFHERNLLYLCIACVGLGNANVFPIIFSQAILHLPEKKNEVSGLMIMGLFGGAVFPLLMGIASDFAHAQNGAIAIVCLGICYLIFFSSRIK
ncbi:MFS transporter [Bacteroidia bacterium]|nr:MFS transporter [Bacteroidia bacterium]GHU54955.1 MFS transporter [Bacteroidia bacterium]